MHERSMILSESDIDRILKRISHEILEKNKGSSNIVFIGILKRGFPLAQRIAANIEKIEDIAIPVGSLDITFYRDDLGKKIKSDINVTDIPFPIINKDVILVDDVLFTGRTIRAALDAIIDFGRPRTIQLAALIDRGHRELPIRADYVGKNVPTSLKEYVDVGLQETDGTDKVSILKERKND